MHYLSTTYNVRRSLIRGLATGLLFAQLALNLSAQVAATPAATPDDQKDKEKVFVLDTYKVTGSFASSLEMAAKDKQNSNALVEVIAPEDIGKLPDVSIADALTRLTGITSQRVNGRDQQINIRGFSPDFNVGTLDGIEQATTNDNRAVEFDQYPSELLGGVTVYKTSQASLVGGLAGTIDLQTTSPLSSSSRIIQTQAFYNWTSLGQQTPGVKKAGESYSVSYIDQFDGGKEGIFLGYAHTENPTAGQQYGAWGYSGANDGSAVNTAVYGANTTLTSLGGMKFYDYQELLKRDSFVAV
ncbi:MAG: TonB-dependent receptor plug domain-containing protein, partial [Tepidisphaerales bacterium]